MNGFYIIHEMRTGADWTAYRFDGLEDARKACEILAASHQRTFQVRDEIGQIWCECHGPIRDGDRVKDADTGRTGTYQIGAMTGAPSIVWDDDPGFAEHYYEGRLIPA